MAVPLTRSLRPDRAALGVRWLVLLTILFGTIVSSVGGLYSHGIAAIAAVGHISPASFDTDHDHDDAHGHAHEDCDCDGEWVVGSQGASADHPHHGADHSHDKAHALPAAWHTAAAVLPVWFGQATLRIETAEPSRLERPPMG